MSVNNYEDMSSFIVSTGDGLLEVTEECLRKIIRTEPISNVYHVEQTPFARGKFAAVRKVRHLATGKEYAAKFIRKRRRAQDTSREINHEVAVLLQCAHVSRIVRLHEVFDTRQEVALILELAAGGELQGILDTEECLEEHIARRYMRQILEGLCHLHEHNVAHLDLKPQNLLLTANYPCPEAEVKLCDFGISRLIEPGVEVREILGTPDYVAPEILAYEPISLATDIWSVGVLAYVLLSGYSPFGADTKQETYLNISQCSLTFPPELFSDVSSLAQDFVRSTLIIDPRKRPSAQNCLEHPWLTTNVSITPQLPAPCELSNTVESSNNIYYTTEKVNSFNKSESLSPLSVTKCFSAQKVENLTPTAHQCSSYSNLSTEGVRQNYSSTENLTPKSIRKYSIENSPSRNYNVPATCLSCAQCGATCCHLPHVTHNVSKPVITVDRGILC